MLTLLTALLLFQTSPAQAPAAATPPKEQMRTYRIQQVVTLSDIPADAGKVQWWVSIPDNNPDQAVLDFKAISVPGSWSIQRDAERGNRFLYIELDSPKAAELQATVEFTVRREPVLHSIDPKLAGPITAVHKQLYAEELDRDAPHMQVTPALQEMADKVCGAETNPAIQARALLQHVIFLADHYSKDPSKPNCGVGDAGSCVEKGGGCCTDLHSLFIALARARGIPARLQMGYRINPTKPNTMYDPGYRCWVEYFVPNYGWVPADAVEADAVGGLGPDRWFSGLTEWRVWLNEGRQFTLRPAAVGAPVNTMVIGHAVIDGKVARVLPEGDLKPQLNRRIQYAELP